ncbi:hypothetical protein BC829DRAFT_407365 [Chytridium lagenaria]|nr:hypothetical protein BC829DRAFT_407365 [Chytridium lagenaria]
MKKAGAAGKAKAAFKKAGNAVRAAGKFKKAGAAGKAKAAWKKAGNAVKGAGKFKKAGAPASAKRVKGAWKKAGKAVIAAKNFKKAGVRQRFKKTTKRNRHGLAKSKDVLKRAGKKAKLRGAVKKVATVSLMGQEKEQDAEIGKDCWNCLEGCRTRWWNLHGFRSSHSWGYRVGCLGSRCRNCIYRKKSPPQQSQKAIRKVGGTPKDRGPWHKRILSSQRIANGVGHASGALGALGPAGSIAGGVASIAANAYAAHQAEEKGEELMPLDWREQLLQTVEVLLLLSLKELLPTAAGWGWINYRCYYRCWERLEQL